MTMKNKYIFKIKSLNSIEEKKKLFDLIDEMKKLDYKVLFDSSSQTITKIIVFTNDIQENKEEINKIIIEINKILKKIPKFDTFLNKQNEKSYEDLSYDLILKDYKKVESLCYKLIMEKKIKEIGQKNFFNKKIFFENLNISKEIETTYIETSQWFLKIQKLFEIYDINTKELTSLLRTNTNSKQLMGDYVFFNDTEGEKNIDIYDIKNYENIPKNVYRNQIEEYKNTLELKNKEDIQNFIKTSEPNLNLLSIVNMDFYKDYIKRKIKIKDTNKKNFKTEEIINNVNEIKEKISNFSKGKIKDITLNYDGRVLFEIFKIFEYGYSNNLLRLSGYEINSSLITMKDDGSAEHNTLNEKKIKSFFESPNKLKLKLNKGSNGYTYCTIENKNNIKIYSFSFRKYDETKEIKYKTGLIEEDLKLEGNCSLINKDFLELTNNYSKEETKNILNKEMLYLPPNLSEDIYKIITKELQFSEEIDMNLISKRYLQKYYKFFEKCYKPYSQISKGSKKNNKDSYSFSNTYDKKGLYLKVTQRLKKNNNPSLERFLKKKGIKRVKNQKGITVFKLETIFDMEQQNK